MSHFRSRGWAVERGGNNPQDLRIDKNSLKFNIEYVDESALQFRSVEQVVELMESHARRPNTRIGLLHVARVGLPISMASLEPRGIILMTLDELTLVSDLEQALSLDRIELDRRQIRMLQHNEWACVQLAEKYHNVGDKKAALDWMRRAIAPNNPVSSVHHAAFSLFIRMGNIPEAKELALGALDRKKEDVFFVKALLKISQDENDEEGQEKWSGKLKKLETESSSNIHDILRGSRREPSVASGQQMRVGTKNSYSTALSKWLHSFRNK